MHVSHHSLKTRNESKPAHCDWRLIQACFVRLSPGFSIVSPCAPLIRLHPRMLKSDRSALDYGRLVKRAKHLALRIGSSSSSPCSRMFPLNISSLFCASFSPTTV